jgi:hypothetical protein
MRRQVISSRWTLVFKLFVPIALVALSVLLLLSLFAFPEKISSDAIIGTLLVIAATTLFCCGGASLKQVSIDEHIFYVAGLTREIAIPFNGIHSIYALQDGWPVIVRFTEKSDFGRTIIFLAKWRPLPFGSSHPVVQQLQSLRNGNRFS